MSMVAVQGGKGLGSSRHAGAHAVAGRAFALIDINAVF